MVRTGWSGDHHMWFSSQENSLIGIDLHGGVLKELFGMCGLCTGAHVEFIKT